jgi:DNA polymerase III delta subunit
MTIIHGENTIKSRQALLDLIEKYKSRGFETLILSAKNLATAQLEQALGGDSLFGSSKVVIVEELHSQQESAKRKQLITLLSATTSEVILWEKRLLTATMLKKFPKASVDTYKASSILFSWLDSLGKKGNPAGQIKQLQDICKQESAQFCLSMITRQIRLLIASKNDGQLKAAPFVVVKLKSQAQQFTIDQLVALHTKLLQIEFAQKRSLSKLSLEQQLQLFVLGM